jgi:hypothetical protein
VLDSDSDVPVDVEVDALLGKAAEGRSTEALDGIIEIGVAEVSIVEVAREVSDKTIESSALTVLLGVALTLLGTDDMLAGVRLVTAGDMLLERVLDNVDEVPAPREVGSNDSVAELALEI